MHHDEAEQYAAFVETGIFQTAELKDACKSEDRCTNGPAIEGEPGALVHHLMKHKIGGVSHEAIADPGGEIAEDHERQQQMAIRLALDQATIDL